MANKGAVRFGTFWNVLERFGTFWNVAGKSLILKFRVITQNNAIQSLLSAGNEGVNWKKKRRAEMKIH